MRKNEAVNCSLALLLFCFNTRYSSFFKNSNIRVIYQHAQLFDVNSHSENDFIILTNNSLLSALQTHANILNESIKNYCSNVGRPSFKNDPLFDFIRMFVSELRNATSHFGKSFLKFTWEHTFAFECWIPVEKISRGHYRFKYGSKSKHKVMFRGTKNHELRITPGFIYRMILFSFHVIKILSFRKNTKADKYLMEFEGKFRTR